MSKVSIQALELASLLAQATCPPELDDLAEAAFSDYDWERVCQLCQTESLYCDQPVQHLVITARKGGFLNGNYCFLAGLLYQTAEAAPMASLETRFSAYLAGPEIYLQSLRSPFTWHNDYAAMHTAPPEAIPSAADELLSAEFTPQINPHRVTATQSGTLPNLGAPLHQRSSLAFRLRHWLGRLFTAVSLKAPASGNKFL